MSDLDIPRNWTFENSSVAQNFDRHVREQLPWYDLVTGAVTHIVRHYLPQDGIIYDIGASTGNIGRALDKLLEDRQAQYRPIESSYEMIQQYDGPQSYNLISADALTVAYEPFDVAVLFLVLMFMKVDERLKYIVKLHDRMKAGGCLVIVDKVESSEYFGTVMRRLTLAGKV